MSAAEETPAAPTASGQAWTVVLPVKPWATAKSRLASDALIRADLARAFVLDVVTAVRATPGVVGLLLVSREPALQGEVSFAVPPARDEEPPGQKVDVLVVDDHGDTLDDSVRHGVRRARYLWPQANVAVVTSDLPSLQPDQLAAVLAAAAGHTLAAVADTEGTGTTVLTVTGGADLRPAYGAGSFARHVRLGAADVTWAAPAGVRRDVDIHSQLEDAARIGVGPHTSALTNRRAADSPSGKPVQR